MFQNQTHDEFIEPEALKTLINQEWDGWEECMGTVGERDEEQQQLVRQCCALCAYWKDNGRGALEFYHNNIRDFFLCEYLYERLLDCLTEDGTALDENKFIVAAGETFPHRMLASDENSPSTWEQTLRFLYCRLLYEVETGASGKTLCKIPVTETQNPLPELLDALISTRELLDALGRGRCAADSLTQIKNVYGNALMLSRVWQEVFRGKGTIVLAKLWNTEVQRNHWTKVFSAFAEPLFFLCVWISEAEKISVGSHSDLYDADLCNADLIGADLRYADLRYADLRYADLRYADLSKADLSEAKLRGAKLIDAKLRGTKLIDAKLTDADLSDADLRGAKLRYADLRYADLCGAKLRGADLCGAKLRGADLCGAKLIDADLRYANLCETPSLRSARDLAYAKNVEEAHLPVNCHVKKNTKKDSPPYIITWDEDEPTEEPVL